MEQSCWKIPFSILQFTKEAEYAISWSKIRFFRNVARFAHKFLSIRTLLLTHSKLVWTPCICCNTCLESHWFCARTVILVLFHIQDQSQTSMQTWSNTSSRQTFIFQVLINVHIMRDFMQIWLTFVPILRIPIIPSFQIFFGWRMFFISHLYMTSSQCLKITEKVSLMRLFEKECYQTGNLYLDKKMVKVPKLKNSNETFWVVFKQCGLVINVPHLCIWCILASN